MKNKNKTPNSEVATLLATPAGKSGQSKSDAVAAKAYELYVQQGYPEGRSLDHWLEAEASVGVQSNASM